VDVYFFANRNSHWLVVGLCFLTTCIFSPYIFGLTSSGSASGLPIAYGIVSAIMLVLLAWFLAPLYLRMGISTLPEYFEKRFNRACKFFLSALFVLSNIFLRLLIVLVIGSILIKTIAGVDAYSPLLFFLVVTGIYVIIGGLKAEISVNIVLVLFITLGVVEFFGWVIDRGNGINLAVQKIAFLPNFDARANSEFTLTGLIFGLPIIGFWFWCADQVMIQKVLSVRNLSFARKATVVAGLLQIIPILICILPGMILNTLSQNKAPAETFHAIFSSGLLPESLRGGLFIAVAAALMASFAGIFNSTSALITFDFYRSLKPSASDRKLVLVGRLTTMILVFCAILLIPISQTMDFGLSLRLFKVFAYIAAMIAAVFVVGLLGRKIGAISALLTLCTGAVIILLRAILEMNLDDHPLGNNLLNWFAQSGFLEFSVFILLVSVCSSVGFFGMGLAYGSFLSRNHKAYILKAKQ
jgi:SSS family solute:Na+ symporter